jgi:hypothetical protein
VSSAGQNLDRQIGALRAERCDEIFREKASGKGMKDRPQLERAIDQLGTGDVLVVAEWDRATRSMMDGVAIIERIGKRGALIKVLDKPTSTSPRRLAAGSSPSSARSPKTSASASSPAAMPAVRLPRTRASSSAASPSSMSTSGSKPASGSRPVKAPGRLRRTSACTT